MSKSRRLTAVVFAASAVGRVRCGPGARGDDHVEWRRNQRSCLQGQLQEGEASGHPSKVKDFASKQLHYTCTANTGQSPFRASTTIHTPITVHSGSFFADQLFNSGNIKVSYTITGKFASKTKATGTYKERRALDRGSDQTLRQPQGALEGSQAVAGRAASG